MDEVAVGVSRYFPTELYQPCQASSAEDWNKVGPDFWVDVKLHLDLRSL